MASEAAGGGISERQGAMTRNASFANPVGGMALGDPFVLRHRGRFYLYGTNDGPPLPDGRQIPAFRSDDLLTWEPLGGVLEPSEPRADHWAPEVLAWNGKFFMVVSFGDVERKGHALWVAEADRPEGPFRLKARVSDPSEVFSIDGSWLLDDDGKLYLFRCLDFVAEGEPPYGTGIIAQPMRSPTEPAGPPVTVLRAHSPWQLFEANRKMPLYGGRTFPEWTTIEGPAPVKRGGRYYCGYSGGNYTGAYGTGEAVAEHPLGPYRDLRGVEGPIFGTTPGLVEGPGHFSVIQPDAVHDWIVLHGRRPGEGPRRVWLCPAHWGVDGVTIGPLTDQPQPAPPLPDHLSRFEGPEGSTPPGWRFEGGTWGVRDGQLWGFGSGGNPAAAWLERMELAEDWVVEVYVRFPGARGGHAGLTIVGGGPTPGFFAQVSPEERSCVANWSGGRGRSCPIPTLGDDAYEPRAFHAIEVRARSGRGELRFDGVRLCDDLPLPLGPARLGLVCEGEAAFDAAAVTLVPRPGG